MLKNYFLTALRNLKSHTGYSLINILGLSIGIACCVIILLYVRNELSFDAYNENADRIYRIEYSRKFADKEIYNVRTPAQWALDLKNDYPAIAEFVRLKPPRSRWMVKYEDRLFFEKGFVFADSTVFSVFDFELVRGNPKDVLAAPNTVVLTEEMAHKYFGNEDPIGETILLDNKHTITVTGIMKRIPRNSHFDFDFLASFSTLYSEPGIFGGLPYLAASSQYTYVLLAKNASASDLESALPGFVDKYLRAESSPDEQIKIELMPLTDIHLHSHREYEFQTNGDISDVYMFSIIAFIILLIASMNFMNLTTARSANRAKEIGIRKVVGARRAQLAKQFVGESTLVALISLVFACLFVRLSLPYFNQLSERYLSFDLFRDPFLILSLIAIAAFVGVLAGSYPALYLSGFKPVMALKGTLSKGAKRVALWRSLVFIQFTVSIVLIIGTAAVFHQLYFMQNRSLGFDKDHVVVIPLPDPAVRGRFDALASLLYEKTGVLNVAASSSLPGGLYNSWPVVMEGMNPEDGIIFNINSVSEHYFETLHIDLVGGRTFLPNARRNADRTVILNETAVKKLHWEDPIGKTLALGPQFRPRVIGVVKDYHFRSMHQPIEPLMIFPRLNDMIFLSIRIRPGNLERTISQIEEAWRTVNPEHVFEYTFLDQDYDDTYKTEKRFGEIFGLFAGLAIFVACLGLYGIAAYAAEQRTKEIGIRKVLGASNSTIVRLLNEEFTKIVLVANLTAWPIAYYLIGIWMKNFAYKSYPGVGIYVGAAVVSVFVAGVTVARQSIRSANIQPVKALKYE
jgi:putative ABC transport system permease protein